MFYFLKIYNHLINSLKNISETSFPWIIHIFRFQFIWIPFIFHFPSIPLTLKYLYLSLSIHLDFQLHKLLQRYILTSVLITLKLISYTSFHSYTHNLSYPVRLIFTTFYICIRYTQKYVTFLISAQILLYFKFI